MTTGWIMFVTFAAMGLFDLIIGFVFWRGSGPVVGAPPPAPGESTQSKRVIGRTMMISAVMLWIVAGAAAYGLLGSEFALPMFGGPTS